MTTDSASHPVGGTTESLRAVLEAPEEFVRGREGGDYYSGFYVERLKDALAAALLDNALLQLRVEAALRHTEGCSYAGWVRGAVRAALAASPAGQEEKS